MTVLCILCMPSRLLAEENREYNVKAVYLYNFFNYITWPQDRLKPGQAAILCIFGQNPFGEALNYISKKSSTANPIKIRQIATPDKNSIESCHIAFIHRSEKSHLDQYKSLLNSRGVLTVSDIPSFSQQTGAVEFTVENEQIKLAINQKALANADLQASSKLLKLARIID